MTRNRNVRALVGAGALAWLLATATAARSEETEAKPGSVTSVTIEALMPLLAKACPVAPPGEVAAYDRCRSALYQSGELRKLLRGRILWGAPQPDVPFWKLKLTTLGSEVMIGLYLPLFMFSGDYRVTRDGNDSWVELRAATAFRNVLPPGQYPYPFWHLPEKWGAYEQTNELVFRIDPMGGRVWGMLRSRNPTRAPLLADYPKVVPPAFDGQWVWQGEGGRDEPRVAFFDGLVSDDNPFKAAMLGAYRNLALSLRDQSCASCHNPKNPSRMSPLVLLQTPAHAAGEIEQLIRAIESGRMPIEEWGAQKPLAPEVKAEMLGRARAFAEARDRSLAWELTHTPVAP